ncbi:NAD-dependent epimerase/dehydratase family protein [Micromonospora auratinigra]|uniref:NAD dependent epimerase/dehydratase family protein n=1 Tax=Micromonospora auratinigra TaxID=261654 RepID=A0A1A8Z1D3_9ACTN|nr:NAD-dependent epimerase/dehydratase family protein [Micromonospora auratinigra]SBT37694.1 NAD dependent epimerase/dehydratase family protein [Micromonospora auratinigra]
MLTGLVGNTGFVGANLARQRAYDLQVHRPTVGAIDGRRFGRLVISAAPGVKWRANADPAADAAAVDTLIDHLRRTSADEAVLISTVDVYPEPRQVDEATAPDPDDHPQAYGRHRLRLERFVRQHYPRCLIVRLPALFGPGLRKNLVHDLMTGRTEEFCHRRSTFQFYDLGRLTTDLDRAVAAGLPVLNLATEPLPAETMAREVFGRTLRAETPDPVHYDVRTRHAAVFGADGPYVCGRDEVLAGLRTFAGERVPA